MSVIGWRDTPMDADAIGRMARASQPYIEQLFIQGAAGDGQDELERKLYVIRRRAENGSCGAWISRTRNTSISPRCAAAPLSTRGCCWQHRSPSSTWIFKDPDAMSAICLVHQRFSTNTFPTWQLAHPFRYLCHNGEINTLKGNIAWMNARQPILRSELFGEDLTKLFPIIAAERQRFGGAGQRGGDAVPDGKELPHVLAMLIPEAWDHDKTMDPQEEGVLRISRFTDGTLGRPCRRGVHRWPRDWRDTRPQWSAARPLHGDDRRPGHHGVGDGRLAVPAENVKFKGRLQPGKMLLVDTVQGRIIPDDEIKEKLASRQPYADWLQAEPDVTLTSCRSRRAISQATRTLSCCASARFGYTDEELRMIWRRWRRRARSRSVPWAPIRRWRACPTGRSCSSITSSSSSRR